MKAVFNLYRKYLQLPDHPGKLPFSRWVGAKIFPKEGAVFTVDKDIRMYLHPMDWLEFSILNTGKYEPKTLDFLEKNILPGEYMLLAGTNFGLHVIHASRCTGKEGCVIGVEPQPRSLYRTYKNIKLNNLPQNIILVSGALGKKSSLVPVDDAPLENSALATLNHTTNELPFYVQVETVPVLLNKLNVKKIDVLLLDVEGYEMNILEGMSKHNLPRLMIIEVNSGLLDKENQRKIYDILNFLGYSCYTLHGETVKLDADLPEHNTIAVLTGSNLPHFI